SLMAVTLYNRIQEELGRTISVITLFDRCSVAELARELSSDRALDAGQLFVPIRPGGRRRPLVGIHGLWGDVFYFRRVAAALDAEIPVFGFRQRGLDDGEVLATSVEAMAEEYVDELLRHDADGPHQLCGYSFGGIVAFEMARRLTARGRRVGVVALIDTIN